MENIFICPNCKHAMKLPLCYCGFTVPYNNGIYQLTSDPYIIKDDSAEIKYIGYEDIAEAYSGGDYFRKMAFEEKSTCLADIIGNGTLLDLACGDGLYTVPLLKHGIKIIAMDISDKMLSLLYKRADILKADISRLNVCRANALNIPLVDYSIDAVIANSVLHLISKPEIVVGEIYRVLKKGGKFITLEDKPNKDNISDKNENLSVEEKLANNKHKELIGYVHRRYFQILKDEYGILGTRYSWKFDREKICDELFDRKETFSIPIENKITTTFNDTFLFRMRGKGYSDQSNVPQNIHKDIFDRVMSEFTKEYGEFALDTIWTEYENDVKITIYIK